MKYFYFFALSCILIGCAGPEARRPVKVRSGSFIETSVERSKQLLANEQQLIQQLIINDSLHQYQSSANGAWYFYEQQNETSTYFIQSDDMVTLTYNIVSLNNDTIYSEKEVGVLTYKVDKQDLFPGLRNNIKLLKDKEKATFLFPSSLAYGYHGDGNKIGANIAVKSTITILNVVQKKDSIQN